MDKTELYIDMSEKAKPFLKMEPSEGDYVVHKSPVKTGNKKGNVHIYVNYKEPITYNKDNIDRLIYKDYSDDWIVPLPKQDQLQEMIPHTAGGAKDNFWTDLCKLVVLSDNLDVMAWIPLSMEQLLLAYVMKEAHDRLWENNDWVLQWDICDKDYLGLGIKEEDIEGSVIFNEICPRCGGHKYIMAIMKKAVGNKKKAYNCQDCGYKGEWNMYIVCLCGSAHFSDELNSHRSKLISEGKLVLSPEPSTVKVKRDILNELHLRKIDLADEVIIMNVSGYIGSDTAKEIAYAKSIDKKITYFVKVLKSW